MAADLHQPLHISFTKCIWYERPQQKQEYESNTYFYWFKGLPRKIALLFFLTLTYVDDYSC